MKSVSRFEAHLLRLLRFFLHQGSVQQALPLLEAPLERPKCLTRTAVDLVKDALAKGIVVLLCRRGAWRVERHLRAEQIVEGRLWQRTPPQNLGLTFSVNTLDFLVWITAKKQAEEKQSWKASDKVTVGDLLFLFFAYEQLRSEELGTNLLQQEPLRTHGLVWLAYPDELARQGIEAQPDFAPWLDGVGACMLEALQPALAERWVRMEVDKGNVYDWKQMRDIGQAQDRALDRFLKSVETANRPDLARFLLMTAARVVTPGATPQLWTRSLQQHGARLADRSDTYRGALAFPRVLSRLQQWERRARSVGFLDEGYQATQLWKADWERFEGDVLTERALSVIRQLDPMRQTEE